MQRSAVALALAAALLGVAALAVSQMTRSDVAQLQSAPKAKDPALERLEAKVDALVAEVQALHRERQEAVDRLAVVERDLGAARRTLGEQAVALRNLPSGAAPVAAADPQTSATEDAAQEAAKKAEFEALGKKIFAHQATPDEQARFWELARTTGVLTDLIAELSKKVEQAPADADARMQLAQGYLAKLLTVPDGPERGAWAMKANEQWQKVLESQPEHWEARFSLAIAWSRWPDFLNKTPDAIREFETLRQQQARMNPEPHQSQTYLQLALLYRKVGNYDKAKQVLQEGLVRHPGEEALQKAMEDGGR